ncbi:MAG: helix-turn-helix domain-containing protein [Aeromonas sp.]
MSEPSKTRSSFYRRLYVAWLITQGCDTVPAIMATTRMPRRTAQDTVSALAELGITCTFEQTQGARHLQGHYQISDWGPINPN